MASDSKKQRLTAIETETEYEEHPFTEEPGITDFALVVEGKKLFVNKAVLSMVSPVFKTMFISDFKEKILTELELPEKSYEDVVEFLKFVYPNPKPLNFNTVTQILPLLHEYDCEYQLEQCEAFLKQHIPFKERYVDKETLLKCLRQSEMCDLKGAYTVCIQEASKYSLSVLRSTNFFKFLPSQVRERLHAFRLEKFEKAVEKFASLFPPTREYRDTKEFKDLEILLNKNSLF